MSFNDLSENYPITCISVHKSGQTNITSVPLHHKTTYSRPSHIRASSIRRLGLSALHILAGIDTGLSIAGSSGGEIRHVPVL